MSKMMFSRRRVFVITQRRLVCWAAAVAAGIFGSPSRSFAQAPVIGINMEVRGGEVRGGAGGESGESPDYWLAGEVVDAVTSAGGIVITLPAPGWNVEEAARRHVALCDGLVLVGGADPDPARYGETPDSTYKPISARREAYDFELVRQARLQRKPVLGICLGMQELNVAAGGSLIQDLPTDARTSGGLEHRPQGIGLSETVHAVDVAAGTALLDAVGTRTLAVNSAHHEAVGRVGEGLRAVAVAGDGVIEAIESERRGEGAAWWVLGVQWHPEQLAAEAAEHQRIFEALVKAAGKGRASSSGQK